MVAEQIHVAGLREFAKALKQLDANAPKAVRLAGNEVADLIVTRTRPLIPRKTGKAAGSLKASSTRTLVRISMGGPRAPHMPWLDWGGKTGRQGAARPFIKEGRYLYPTFRANRDEAERVLTKALVKAAEDAGLDVS